MEIFCFGGKFKLVKILELCARPYQISYTFSAFLHTVCVHSYNFCCIFSTFLAAHCAMNEVTNVHLLSGSYMSSSPVRVFFRPSFLITYYIRLNEIKLGQNGSQNVFKTLSSRKITSFICIFTSIHKYLYSFDIIVDIFVTKKSPFFLFSGSNICSVPIIVYTIVVPSTLDGGKKFGFWSGTYPVIF